MFLSCCQKKTKWRQLQATIKNSEMPTYVTLPTSHHFHPSLSPVVSLSLGILHEWMRTQMLAKPSLNLHQRTGGDHWGGRAQLGWRTFMMTCLRWILGFMRLEIWCKIGLSGDWCLCTALRTRSGACYYWISEQATAHAKSFRIQVGAGCQSHQTAHVETLRPDPHNNNATEL